MGRYVAVCALTVAVGWCLRGQFGHEYGAMIPGALAGLAAALSSVDERKRGRVRALAVAGALGMAVGGVLSYGSLFAALSDPGQMIRATTALVVRGATWGCIAGAAMGMALSNTRYTWLDLLWLTPVAVFWYATGNVPEGDSLSAGGMDWELPVVAAAFAVWLLVVKRDRPALLVAACLACGFGLGLASAGWLVAAGPYTGIDADWWKIGEFVWGLAGGACLGLALYVLDEDHLRPADPNVRRGGWAATVFLAWWIPCRNGFNVADYWANEKGILPSAAVWGYVVLAFAALFGAMLLIQRRSLRFEDARLRGAVFYLWILWSTMLLQAAKMTIPAPPAPRDIGTQFALFVATLGLSVWALWQMLAARGASNTAPAGGQTETP